MLKTSSECTEMPGVYFAAGRSKKKENVETSRKCAELCIRNRGYRCQVIAPNCIEQSVLTCLVRSGHGGGRVATAI